MTDAVRAHLADQNDALRAELQAWRQVARFAVPTLGVAHEAHPHLGLDEVIDALRSQLDGTDQ